jgi:hypothetical protein
MPESLPDLPATDRIAVCADRDSAWGRAVESILARNGVNSTRWYAPRDADDLNQAAIRGEFETVWFGRADDLWTALFDGDIDVAQWRQAGVTIELADWYRHNDAGQHRATDADPQYAAREAVFTAGRLWSTWRAQKSRRKAIANLILSIIVVAAATLVMAVPLLR